MISDEFKWAVVYRYGEANPSCIYHRTRKSARSGKKAIEQVDRMKAKVFKVFHGQDFMALVEYKK